MPVAEIYNRRIFVLTKGFAKGDSKRDLAGKRRGA